MTTKEKLIRLLEENEGEFLSGSTVADNLGITRAAIWKNIKQLEAEGYSIEAVQNQGYRLSPVNDVISERCILGYLADDKNIFSLEVQDTLPSTNTALKEKAETLPDWYVLAAGSQSAGRGRVGRGFFSPEGTGLYLSILLRPSIPVTESGKLTTAAAVAACRAIEACTEAEPQIKWVNDVFVGGKKVCGILTEASVNYETGAADWIVVGIGFNVYTPEGGFPEELEGIAGAISSVRQKDLRSRLAAEFIRAFYEICSSLKTDSLYQEYKNRCFLIGKPVYVMKEEGLIPATALDIQPDFGLLVRYEDGTKEVLSAGEVSIRPQKI